MNATPLTEPSNFVSSYDKAFYFIAGVSMLLLICLTLTMVYFIFRYNRKKNKVATQIEGNLILEVLWTVIPVLLSLVMFYLGWQGWKPMNKPPKDGMTVTSVARMWNFMFLYENGKQSPNLIVPVNTPVKIKLVSMDVIHSLFIPDFRVKSDMIPGREKMMWFLPELEGEYSIFCAEYCGLQHSFMHSKVNVLSQEKFNEWYIDTSKVVAVATTTGPGAAGEVIMMTLGCFACHSTDGTKIIGPSYLNLYGEQQVVIRDGKEVTVTVNDEYIKKSVLDPNAEIVKGFPKGLMQTYSSSVNDEDISKIIEYLKTLKEK
jgi:cytochrome c oxidase subunit 2